MKPRLGTVRGKCFGALRSEKQEPEKPERHHPDGGKDRLPRTLAPRLHGAARKLRKDLLELEGSVMETLLDVLAKTALEEAEEKGRGASRKRIPVWLPFQE